MTASASVAATGITYRRAGRTILDCVDLTAPAGAVTAIVGPSGSGKSTLLAILGGLTRPDHGAVHNPYPPDRTAFILQAYGLVSLLTAAENVEIALQTDRALSRLAIRAGAAAALADVGLTDVADHLIEALSGGQQQRVAIARALVARPHLLLADEFTAELDRATRDRMNDLVRGVAARGGTVIIATHDTGLLTDVDSVVDLGR